jgi:hypothetical protein
MVNTISQESMMVKKKGTLAKITGAVGDAVHSVAAGVGLAGSPASKHKPKSKSHRKASRKVAVAREGEARKARARAKR